jgi:hypothetical protein
VAIYYVWSGAAGTNNGSSWANAFTTLTAAFATEVAGDTLYVAHDHAESTAAAITLTSSGVTANPTKVICVNRAGTVPPVSADIRATAQVSTTGASNITFAGFAHYDGIIFSAGNSTSIAHLIVTTAANQWLRFDNCSLRLGGSAPTNLIYVGGSAGSLGATYIELNNTTVSFTNVAQTIQFVTMFRWRNTPSSLLGTIPDILFSPVASRGGRVECIGVDFSAAGSGKTIAFALGSTSQAVAYNFVDCKLNAAVTKSTVPSGYGTCDVDFVRSGSSGVNYQIHRQRISGLLTEETTIVRTGGASDGTTPLAWKIITTVNCTYSMPFECPPIAIWNDTTGSAVTATVECIGAALPTDAEVWLDVEYLGDASSPQGSFVNDGKADLIAAAGNQTSSSETWGGSTAAFKLACTFTAQQKGWIYARVKIGKASSTFYIDPLVTLT